MNAARDPLPSWCQKLKQNPPKAPFLLHSVTLLQLRLQLPCQVAYICMARFGLELRHTTAGTRSHSFITRLGQQLNGGAALFATIGLGQCVGARCGEAPARTLSKGCCQEAAALPPSTTLLRAATQAARLLVELLVVCHRLGQAKLRLLARPSQTPSATFSRMAAVLAPMILATAGTDDATFARRLTAPRS